MQPNTKFVSLIFLGAAVLVGLLCRELSAFAWASFHLPTPRGWILEPADLVGIGIGIFGFLIALRNATAVAFTGEVIVELAKVVWPQRKETVLSTGIVSLLVGICAVILFVFDILWGTLVNFFY